MGASLDKCAKQLRGNLPYVHAWVEKHRFDRTLVTFKLAFPHRMPEVQDELLECPFVGLVHSAAICEQMSAQQVAMGEPTTTAS